MKRVEISPQLRSLLTGSRRVAVENDIDTLVILAELPYDFTEISRMLKKVRLLVATDKPDVQRAAREDEVALIVLLDEPQTRQVQISQAIIDAVADELLESGRKIMAMYAGFERDVLDSVSIINLTEHLAKLTARDLRRLQTKVPLETLRIVVDLAIDIGNEGREGSPVGALFVVGDHRKVIRQSHEQVHDPFRGYGKKECLIRSPRVRESIKELAQLDGAFVISSDGVVQSAGRILDAPAEGLTLSSGLGARHWAAAAISKATNAIAIAVSHSTGTVRIFQDGFVVLRIEPMQRGMKWSDVETEPPATSE